MSDNIGHNSKTEYEKRLHALSDGEIQRVFDYVCYDRCKERYCRNEISKNKSVSDSLNVVENLRKHLWLNPPDLNNTLDRQKKLLGRDHRNVQLIDTLFQMKNPATKEINYTIGYDRVSIIISVIFQNFNNARLYRYQCVRIFSVSVLGLGKRVSINY